MVSKKSDTECRNSPESFRNEFPTNSASNNIYQLLYNFIVHLFAIDKQEILIK